MDDEQIRKFIATFAEQFLILEAQVAQLRTSVNVLRVLAGADLNPADPADGIRQVQILEKKMMTVDPNAQIRQEAAEVIEALKAAKKKGGPHEA